MVPNCGPKWPVEANVLAEFGCLQNLESLGDVIRREVGYLLLAT